MRSGWNFDKPTGEWRFGDKVAGATVGVDDQDYYRASLLKDGEKTEVAGRFSSLIHAMAKAELAIAHSSV